LIVALAEQLIVEVFDEQGINQLRHRSPATTVAEIDFAVD
jgi:hypothetical protein